MFNTYNPMQYLAIDIANHFGLDKKEYEDRIQWVKDNQTRLEDLIPDADEPILYSKAVNAFRMSQKGVATGHTVALDAVCSGLQIMSAVMGCERGMALTGLIHPNRRTDAYTLLTESMNAHMEQDIIVSREDAKSAVMKGFYGSTKVPKEIFGDLVDDFYATLERECPGAYQLLELLRGAWNPDVDRNTWELPDGHIAMVPVTHTEEKKIHVAQLRYTPVVRIEIVAPQEKGLSLIANGVHSVDGYVLRTLIRRCNYNVREVKEALNNLQNTDYVSDWSSQKQMWLDTNIVDMTMVVGMDKETIRTYPVKMRKMLIRMLNMTLSHPPFEIVCIHDSFACSPVNCDQLRRTYADIMGDLVESTLIDHILNQLYQDEDTVTKHGNVTEIAKKVRESNYGIS